jgi:hypothetical protein
MRSPRTCLYCGAPGPEKDHVIPRCLLEKPYPRNLLTVASCARCNRSYSKDEEYFLAIMAQTGFVSSLRDKVSQGGVVDRMLHRSAGLEQLFLNSLSVADGGGVAMIPDEVRIANVTRKIAFGLFWHRYKPRTRPDLVDFLALKPLHAMDENNFMLMLAHNERFAPKRWKHLQTIPKAPSGKLQVFDFMFIRNWVWADIGRLFCIMRFHETVWAAVRCPNPAAYRSKSRIASREIDETQGSLF